MRTFNSEFFFFSSLVYRRRQVPSPVHLWRALRACGPSRVHRRHQAGGQGPKEGGRADVQGESLFYRLSKKTVFGSVF